MGNSKLRNTIIQGHTLDVLKNMPDESIDCIVTSPPYWGLRFYGEETKTIWDGDSNCEHEWGEEQIFAQTGGTKSELVHNKGMINFQMFTSTSSFCIKCGAWYGQLGLEPTLDMFINHLLQITTELKRVLKKTGTLWWNMGDNYKSSGGPSRHWGYSDPKYLNGRDVNYIEPSSLPQGNIQPKSLCLQNFRLAQRMIDEQGFILRNILVWKKNNCMPSSIKDRFTVDFEPVFFFVKNKKYYFEQQLEPYLAPLNRWGGEQLKANGYSTWDAETGQSTYRDRDMRPNENGRNKRCVWSINTQPLKDAHFAVFPEKLVEPMIKAGCPKEICKRCGKIKEKIIKSELQNSKFKPKINEKYASGSEFISDKTRLRSETIKVNYGYNTCNCNAGFKPGIVLDPFMGAGTVGVVAKRLRRDYIGIELNPEYIKIAEKRIAEILVTKDLFDYE